MFVHSVAEISKCRVVASETTHSDIGDRVDDQPIVSSLLDCFGNEGYRGQETTGENPFLDKVDFTLIYPSAVPSGLVAGKLTSLKPRFRHCNDLETCRSFGIEYPIKHSKVPLDKVFST
jgi:hypothetical protein